LIRDQRGLNLDERPVVASYCATFLKPEMLHIYRQITGLTRFRPIVIAQKRENALQFPVDKIDIIKKPRTHFLRRFWFRQLRDAPWRISRGEAATIMRILNLERAKLLHIYFGHIAVHLLPIIRAWARPSVVSFHGADVMVDLEKPAYRTATLEMLNAVRLVLVRSESLRRAMVDLGCDEKKLRIHRTGIPLTEFPLRPRIWPEDGRWRFLQAGRLVEKKGLRTSLLAFAEFAKQFPQSTFTVGGEGPLRNELRALARDLKIDDRISFAGFVSQSELRDLFYESHIFLHPSETGADGNQEGVPNSMLEAMATGLPVFATRHGGIPEAIENGVSGVLVAERDDRALADELIRHAKDPQKLSILASKGAEAVAQRFEQQSQVRKLEDYYFEAMNAVS
jgi:colanic acid/amylovoran biosynthesis glycosyltransferase